MSSSAVSLTKVESDTAGDRREVCPTVAGIATDSWTSTGTSKASPRSSSAGDGSAPCTSSTGASAEGSSDVSIGLWDVSCVGTSGLDGESRVSAEVTTGSCGATVVVRAGRMITSSESWISCVTSPSNTGTDGVEDPERFSVISCNCALRAAWRVSLTSVGTVGPVLLRVPIMRTLDSPSEINSIFWIGGSILTSPVARCATSSNKAVWFSSKNGCSSPSVCPKDSRYASGSNVCVRFLASCVVREVISGVADGRTGVIICRSVSRGETIMNRATPPRIAIQMPIRRTARLSPGATTAITSPTPMAMKAIESLGRNTFRSSTFFLAIGDQGSSSTS